MKSATTDRADPKHENRCRKAATTTCFPVAIEKLPGRERPLAGKLPHGLGKPHSLPGCLPAPGGPDHGNNE